MLLKYYFNYHVMTENRDAQAVINTYSMFLLDILFVRAANCPAVPDDQIGNWG